MSPELVVSPERLFNTCPIPARKTKSASLRFFDPVGHCDMTFVDYTSDLGQSLGDQFVETSPGDGDTYTFHWAF